MAKFSLPHSAAGPSKAANGPCAVPRPRRRTPGGPTPKKP